MPYPPPAGPPELGIFQGIGLVPELPTLIGNYFLTNLAGLTVWEPVAGGVLPDPSGHGGEFLTTDGVIAFWAPASLLPDPTGHGGSYLGTDGSLIFWSTVPPLATNTVYDIRLYGALPCPRRQSSCCVHCHPSHLHPIASWLQTLPVEGQVAGGVYVPSGGGDFYIDRPLVLPPDTQLFGDSKYSEQSSGWHRRFHHAHARQGDFIPDAISLRGAHFDERAIRLPGIHNVPADWLRAGDEDASDRRFRTLQYAGSFAIGDCFAWSKWLIRSVVTQNPAQIALRCQYKFTTSNTSATHIVGMKGPDIDGAPAFTDVAIGLWVFYNDATATHRFEAYLTTTGNGQQRILSTIDLTPGQEYNLELDYNGSFFDFYVDGVNRACLPLLAPSTPQGGRRPWLDLPAPNGLAVVAG